MLTLNWMLDEVVDTEKALALDILEHILIGTPAAPHLETCALQRTEQLLPYKPATTIGVNVFNGNGMTVMRALGGSARPA